ncbi:MAG: LPS assembly protein LptD [Desulfobacterales bacterium]|jgi:LPS-assembly protein|nr:LPS assembly protein LptD [Desulfobacterales bacterium]
MTPAATGCSAQLTWLRAGLVAALLAVAWLLPDAFDARIAAAAESSPPLKGLSAFDPERPWEIEADRISYDQIRDEYLAEGAVVIRRQDRQLTADRVRYSLQTMTATAEGNVTLSTGADLLTGDYADWDLESERGTIENGTIFIAESNYRIQGNRILKTGPDTYRIDQGSVTTCDGAPPDWQFSGRDITLKEDGSGTAWHAVGRVRDVPAGYYPYISFPARNKRTSGLLIPQGGYSTRRGAFFVQPYYWAINDSSDATFYLQTMSKRGWRPGLEYRYYLTREARGAVMFDFLHDEQTDTGGDSSKRWGYDDSSGTFLRPNQDRYWFRMSHENPLPEGFRARLEIDTVSDQDYLREFKSGYMGYRQSADYFKAAFGTVMDDFDDPIRTNRLLVSKFGARYSLNAAGEYFDDVRKGQNWKETTHKLPVVRFDAPKQLLGQSPFFGNLRSEYVNFWQDRGSRIQRADLYPRAYYPFALPPYMSIEPSLGLRQTVWNQYATDAADTWSESRYFHRELYDARLALFTDLFRVFDLDRGDIQRIRHSLRPQLGYTYIPEVDQDGLPYFDSRDRIENRSRVSYALTNTLTTRSKATSAAPESGPRRRATDAVVDSGSDYDYRDILRLKVGQYYDFARHTEPFSNVNGKLQFFPGQRISLDSEAGFNVYSERLDRYNIGLTLWARRADRLRLEYRFDRDPLRLEEEEDTEWEVNELITESKEKIDHLFSELRLGLTDRFILITSYENDYTDGSTAYGLGFAFTSQCWVLETLFHYEAHDVGFEMRLRLKGIGEFGF